MSEDESRSRELEVLLTETEKRFVSENQHRAAVLCDLFGRNTDEQEKAVFQYLTQSGANVFAIVRQHPELTILFAFICDEKGIGPHHDEQRTKAEWDRAIGAPFARMEDSEIPLELDMDLEEKIGYDHEILFRHKIAGLRYDALLYRHFTGEYPSEVMKSRLVYAMARQYDSRHLPIPPTLRLMLTADDMKELAQTNEEGSALVEKIGKHLDVLRSVEQQSEVRSGVDPRIAQRRSEVKDAIVEQVFSAVDDADQLQIQRSLDAILEQYPDPRVLIDKILDLKDGKLPI